MKKLTLSTVHLVNVEYMDIEKQSAQIDDEP